MLNLLQLLGRYKLAKNFRSQPWFLLLKLLRLTKPTTICEDCYCILFKATEKVLWTQRNPSLENTIWLCNH